MVDEVPMTFGDYTRGRQLGSGASGTVFLCDRRPAHPSSSSSSPGPGPFAVKSIDLRRLRLSPKAEREQKKLDREVDILRTLPEHPNLVQFIEHIQEGNWYFLVLEYVSGGDLFSALVRRPSSQFKEAETVFVLRQLVDGLGFLHAKSVIHRDLKLENILVAREFMLGENQMCDVKITDFGLSKVVGDGRSVAHSTVGSPRYVSPEVISGAVHDFRADLWSLGVLLYVLLAGKFPFEKLKETPQSKLNAIVDGLKSSATARGVVQGLLQLDRDGRMSLDAVRAHAWLAHAPNGCPHAPPLAAGPRGAPPAKRPRLRLEVLPTQPILVASTSGPLDADDLPSPAVGASKAAVGQKRPAADVGAGAGFVGKVKEAIAAHMPRLGRAAPGPACPPPPPEPVLEPVTVTWEPPPAPTPPPTPFFSPFSPEELAEQLLLDGVAGLPCPSPLPAAAMSPVALAPPAPPLPPVPDIDWAEIGTPAPPDT